MDKLTVKEVIQIAVESFCAIAFFICIIFLNLMIVDIINN
jgi:hypothetical protein